MPPDPHYASPAATLIDELESFLPPEKIDVAAFAAQHRWLSNEGGGYIGRWEHAQVPYVVEPMECLTSLDYLTVAIVGPGQSAKTTIAENWMLHSVAIEPADMLWYMQTDQGVEAYVKSRINPMIEAHGSLRSNLGPRPVDDSLHFKRFRGMNVEFLSATPASLINKRAGRIVADEIDAYPASLGDIKVMLDVRRQTFGAASMLLAISHPDRARGLDPERDWTDGITAIYADSDRRLWYWACPHCNGYSSPHPLAARAMTLSYPEQAPLDEIEEEARLLCPCCGALIEDHHRRAMNGTGRWVSAGEDIAEDGVVSGVRLKSRTAGFWITGLMSPFVLGGVGALARARVKAERELEAAGDDGTLRQVMVKQWGLPYVPPRQVGSVDAATLAEAADPRLALGLVAHGVRFLTAFADVQGDRFEVLVRGWGERGESWIVDFFIVPAQPASRSEDWDQLRALLLSRAYPLGGDPSRAMAIRGIGFDSGGKAGVTQQAGDAWLRWRRAQLVRLYGKISGRDAWSILPTKGATGYDAPRLVVSYPDTTRKGRLAAHGAVPQLLFNPNAFKDDLAGQLSSPLGGPWSVHFPAALRSDPPPHLWFEQLMAETRDLRGRWGKAHAGIRNEALDLMVGTHAVARLHGIGLIDWGAPPIWAAPWDVNAMVRPVGEVAASDEMPVAPALPSPGAATPAAARPVAAAGPRPAVAASTRGVAARPSGRAPRHLGGGWN